MVAILQQTDIRDLGRRPNLASTGKLTLTQMRLASRFHFTTVKFYDANQNAYYDIYPRSVCWQI